MIGRGMRGRGIFLEFVFSLFLCLSFPCHCLFPIPLANLLQNEGLFLMVVRDSRMEDLFFAIRVLRAIRRSILLVAASRAGSLR